MLGRISTILDGSAQTSFVYDLGPNSLGRISSATSPPSEANPSGIHVEYTYESVAEVNRGKLQRIDYNLDGGPYHLSFDYDDDEGTAR